MLTLLSYLPKNLLSYLFGLLAVVPIPENLRCWVYGHYARHYGVNLDEASKSCSEYPNLQAFFTRDLKPGLRPIASGLVSPVDGRIERAGRVEAGMLIQAKGKEYSLAELLGSKEFARRLEGGSYATIYLAPGDYHHIHAPHSGSIIATTYIPGTLWPVNAHSVQKIAGLFVKNERLSTFIESERGLLAVVKVGATNVGSIRTTYNDIRGNPASQLFWARPGLVEQYYSEGLPLSSGERIGSFYLGSTVVLVSEQAEALACLEEGSVKYGEALDCTSKKGSIGNSH